MSTIKKGDTVRCISHTKPGFSSRYGHHCVDIGKEYTVKEVRPNGRIVIEGYYKDGSLPITGLWPGIFEKVLGLDDIPNEGSARTTDPATSKKAAKAARPMPLRDRIVNTLAASHPTAGRTGTELATLLGAKLNSVTPRFAELSKGPSPKIKDSGARRDGQIVWVLA